MRIIVIVLFFSSVALAGADNPFVGIWKYDKKKTLDVDFKGHDVSKIKEQYEYVQHSEAGSLLFFSVLKLSDGKEETYHMWLYPDGRVSEEFSRSNKDIPVDRIQSKRLNNNTYELFGVQVDPKKDGKNNWYGTAKVSDDGNYLTFKMNGKPGVNYDYYYKVFRRAQQ